MKDFLRVPWKIEYLERAPLKRNSKKDFRRRPETGPAKTRPPKVSAVKEINNSTKSKSFVYSLLKQTLSNARMQTASQH